MRLFDSATPGTPESAWSLDAVAGLALPGATNHVLVLAAHPDDETLGVGGLIAACTRSGVRVDVVVATDGEASHPASPTHSPAQLAEIRRVEVQAAVEVLAPGATVRFLGLPDGDLARHCAALEAQLARLSRGATHLVTPWSGDGHPDHETCGQIGAAVAARTGAQHWQYPIWAWHWGDPDGPDLPWGSLRRIDLSPADRAAKARALRCHRSQHQPLSGAAGDEALLLPQLLAHFGRPADYVIVRSADAAGYFDAVYARSDDPWGLAERFYERRKRAIALAALPRERFRRAFEPGCATGLITELLARRCDRVLAWDVAERALEQARTRVANDEHVVLESGRIPQEWPSGEFDLIVLSEVGYYCRDLDRLVERVLGSLASDGVVLAVHWRHPAPDHPHTADAVHSALGARLTDVTAILDADFVLHVWTRGEPSVAATEGLVS